MMLLNIDEAIAHAKEIADKNSDCWKHCINDGSCSVCEKEHEQLAEWLEELKKRRSEDYGYMADIHQSIGYRKAIDDFAEKIKENISESLIWGMIANCFKYKNMNDTSDKIVDYVINTANEIAEQLKVGGENGKKKYIELS